ncbi:MAG: DUF998 domain-containing protein [Candidatus Hodarchaeota archaeon]
MQEKEEPKKVNPIREFLLSARFAGWCGIIGPLIAFISIGVAILLSPWFNWYTNALSDLGHPWMLGGSNGVPGTNVAAPVFNGGLSLGGLITLAVTLWLIWHHYFERSILGVIASVILTIAVLFLIAIGIFHEGITGIHFAVSVGFFVSVLLAGMLYGVRLMLEPQRRLWGIIAFLLSLISASVWVIYYTIPVLPFTGVAIPEIISAITAFIWVFPLCIRLILGKDLI